MVPLDLGSDPVRQLLIAPVDDDAFPGLPLAALLDHDRDERVGAHPLDFLAERREGIEMVCRKREIDGHDIRLIVFRTGHAPETVLRQESGAFLAAQRAYPHLSAP